VQAAVHRFARLLRLGGMRVAVSEVVDASRAAASPGLLDDRERLRTALAVCLVKDRRDQDTFDEVFDAFFRLRPVVRPEDDQGHPHGHEDLEDEGGTERLTLSEEPAETPQQGHSHGKPADLRDYFDPDQLAEQYNLHQEADTVDLAALTDELVLSTDQGSALSEAARVQLTTSRLHGAGVPGALAPQTGEVLDVELTVAEELALVDWLAGNADDERIDPALVAALRERLGGVLANLPELLQRYLQKLLALEQRLVEERAVERGAQALGRDRVAERDRLELEESLRRLIRSLHGAPRSRRRVTAAGRVDGGRTMRASMRYDGVPFRPVTVSRTLDRPRLMVLADVSLSVRATTRFTLHLVHGLQSLTAQVRTFAFVADLVEITDLFAEHQTHEALGLVLGGLPAGGVLDVDADSDYGAALTAFLESFGPAVNRRTTLLVLGDGRSNGRDPGLAAFAELTRRARETIWLTPEPAYSWGLGSCDLPRYAEYCDRVHVVRDMTGLERASHLAGQAAGLGTGLGTGHSTGHGAGRPA
jgi:uncharacterized protein